MSPDSLIDEVTALRRDLHRHPELRFSEFDTSLRLRTFVGRFATRVRTGVAETGLLATIESGKPGPVVLLRADMDAYPVNEETELPFRSERPGVAHACGHDVHMAVMAGVLAQLATDGFDSGAVDVLFQPAEEIPFGQRSGARAVLDAGALRARYDAVLGLHCWPQLEAGYVGVDDEIAMAAKDGFQITVDGVGAHAAMHANGRDAILAASSLILALHETVGRRHDPHEMVAFNVGTIEGGASQSLVSNRVVATGTLRTHDDDVRRRLKSAIEDVCIGLGRAHDVAIRLTWADEMPAVMNAPELVALVKEVSYEKSSVVRATHAPLTADDFALFAERWSGLYLKLGVGAHGEAWTPLHSPQFVVDETAISIGIETIEVLTRRLLDGKWNRRTDG